METETVTTKSIFASKTFWFNVLMLLVALLTGLLDTDLVKQHPEWTVWFTSAITLINSVLRFFSVRPVSISGGDIRFLKGNQ